MTTPLRRAASTPLALQKATFLCFCFLGLWAAAGPAYPLKVSPGNHYVADQNDVPFFIQGDSAWVLCSYLDSSNQDYYLSNRWYQGFNSIIVDMHPYYSGGGIEVPGVLTDYYGNLCFTNTTPDGYVDLLSMNP